MRKITVLALLAVTAASQAVLIYDTISPAGGYTFAPNASSMTGAGSGLSGDNFAAIAPPSGFTWSINQMRTVAFFNTAGTYTNFRITYTLYNGVNVGAATDPAFSSQVATTTANYGNLTVASANGGFFFTVGALTGGGVLGWNLPAAPANASGYGVQVRMQFDSGPGNAGFGMRDIAPAVGGGSNGFYYDLNNDGTLLNNEFANFANWTNGNLALDIDARAVPEPASMAVLGLGAAALLRRRKNRAN